MSEKEPSQEEILAQQKAQCPFCRIVKGEIPATKVYEDDHIVAILDINPLTKGHTIVFPKEHVPIMQMMSPESFTNLFSKLKYIVKGVKAGAVCDSVNIFIASGGVAGQQMPHFMLHIVPRNSGDDIDNFTKPGVELDSAQIEQITPALSQNMTKLMEKERKESPISDEQKTAISTYLANHPDMKELLMKNPEKFAEKIVEDQSIRAIFAGIDVKSLSQGLN